MKTAQSQFYTAIIEQDTATGYYFAYVPDFHRGHKLAETLEELTIGGS